MINSFLILIIIILLIFTFNAFRLIEKDIKTQKQLSNSISKLYTLHKLYALETERDNLIKFNSLLYEKRISINFNHNNLQLANKLAGEINNSIDRLERYIPLTPSVYNIKRVMLFYRPLSTKLFGSYQDKNDFKTLLHNYFPDMLDKNTDVIVYSLNV